MKVGGKKNETKNERKGEKPAKKSGRKDRVQIRISRVPNNDKKNITTIINNNSVAINK